MKQNNEDLAIPYPVTNVLANNKSNWKTLLWTCLAFIWEFIIFYLYFREILPLILLISLHIITLALITFFVRNSYRKKEDLRYPLTLLIAIFGMGPAGLTEVLIFSILRPLFSWVAVPFTTWFHDLFPEKENIFSNVFIRIQAGWDDYSQSVEVVPFLDVFQHGTLEQKQMVLDQITEHYKPIYAPLLQSALQDPSNIIRIQAAAIEAKIDHDFEVRLKELLKDKDLKDPRTLLLLAQHYEYYSYLNVLPPNREKENQELALSYYQAYLEKKPEDKRALFNEGRLLARMKNYQGVLDWFDQLPQDIKDHDLNVYPWYLEALYELHLCEKLSSIAQAILPALIKAQWPTDIVENIAVWGEAKHG